MDPELEKDIKTKLRKYLHGMSDEELEQHFNLKEVGIPKCAYCNKILVHKSKDKANDYKDVPSIDHKMPVSWYGKDSWENITITCHECNLIKNTMNDTTYRELLNILEQHPAFKQEMFDQLWKGRKANFMERHIRTCYHCGKFIDLDKLE